MEGDEPGSKVGFPRVHASADFKRPFRFEEEFEIELLVREINRRTVRYFIRFWQLNGDARSDLAATGELVVVCVTRDSKSGEMRAVNLPELLSRQLEQAAPEEFDNN